jgi:hypothetical protein
MTSPIQQFKDFVKTIPSKDTLTYLHDELGKKGVKVIYEKSENFNPNKPVYQRLMFGTFKRSCSFDFPGIIMTAEGPKYKAISVPPPPPVTQYQSKVLYTNFDKNLPITKANDGTTVTLYYFKSKWIISTHRGFEVNAYICASKKTYQDIIDDVLKQYPSFSYDKLDTTKCYTFGFNHSDFHPFMEGKIIEQKEEASPIVKAWFIQSVDLNKFNNADPLYMSYDEDIGIPFQETVKFQSIKQLFNAANNAYNNYVKTGTANYGYLIRAGMKNYLVESTLLKNIRHIFYSNKFNKLDKFDKRKYIVVNSFIDSYKHSIFKTLFPQYNAEFDMMEKKMDELVSSIINISKDGASPKNNVEIVAHELYKQIKPQDVKVENLIYSAVYDTKHTALIYKLVYEE